MKYPKIIRDNIDFNNDTDICNIGFKEGVLADERPYRIEFWFIAGINMATCFISNIDLQESDIKSYLVKNNLFEIIIDRIEINTITDIEDNIFYVINVPLNRKDEEIFNKCLVTYGDYYEE